MHAAMPCAAATEGRMPGPPQRGGRSQGMHGIAVQASLAHPLEYQLYYGN